MHIYPYMNFETLKKYLKEGEVIITFKSMNSKKVFTKTCTLQGQDIKINQKEGKKILVWLVDDKKFEDIELSSIDEIKIK
tara:strand:+ start:546 stop:785 length:240 start_codon:yes stop_codon:yes gene_type:complete